MAPTDPTVDSLRTQLLGDHLVEVSPHDGDTAFELSAATTGSLDQSSSQQTFGDAPAEPDSTYDCFHPINRRPSLNRSGHIHSLPAETVLACLCMVVNADMKVGVLILLGYFQVCSRWRQIMMGDRVLCANVAFRFSHVKLIKKFLRAAGPVPQHLDFDTLISRSDILAKHTASVITFLVEDRLRLSNALSIRSVLPLPQVRWFSHLRSISNFSNLQELHVRLCILHDLPDIHGPKLLSLTVVADELSLIPAHRFVSFMRRLPHLTTLSLNSIGCTPEDSGIAVTPLQLTRLRELSMSNVRYSQYASVLRLISGMSPNGVTLLSFHAPCHLQPIWNSLELCRRTHLQATLAVSENLFRLNLHDPGIDGYPEERDARIRLVTGVGYLQKLYNPGPQTSIDEDLLHDAAVYADKVDIVSLSAEMHSDWHVPLLLNDITGLRVISWLRALPHPTTLVIDSSAHVLIERGMEFIWPSLHSIHIHCRTHRLALREDDQATVDAVARWLQSPILDHEMHVMLVGRKWKHYELVLGDLIDGCADFIDRRK